MNYRNNKNVFAVDYADSVVSVKVLCIFFDNHSLDSDIQLFRERLSNKRVLDNAERYYR